MSKFRELKIRFKVWWENAGSGARAALGGAGGLVFLLAVGLLVYSFYGRGGSKFVSPLAEKNKKNSQEEEENLEEISRPSGEGEKTVPAPINGVLYTEEEADLFLNRRPLAVMINNHTEARPQVGLSKADLIYEAVAEGGITRFLALFHAWDCNKVGPVRSARIYYEDWAAEFNAWYAHWGGAYMDADDKANQDNPNYNFTCDPAADAYAKINRINLPSLDQMWLGSTAYWRDNSRGVATEHTGYTSTAKLWNEAPNKYPGWEGFTEFETWKFKDDNPISDSNQASGGAPAQAPNSGSEQAPASTITFNFWDMPNFKVKWEYVPEENVYKRYQGGNLQVDAGDDSLPLKAKTVILQFTNESSFNDQKNHLNYQTVGSGEALVFMDGKEIEASWKKPAIRERTKYYYNVSGNEIKFNRGQIWIEIIPEKNKGNVEIS